MLPWSAEFAGRMDEHVFSSELLRGNPLGDPHERPLWVYLPPGYDGEPDRHYPSVYVLQGYTGHLAMWRNRTAYRQPFPEAADAMFARGEAPPAIVVHVDAWTRYGGSQFVDSPGTGRYHSYLCDEVVPWVDARYRTQADAAHRAITGKSSGGFAAMITPMLRPDLFGALATHAGDTLYEMCYIPDFRTGVALAAGHLDRRRYQGRLVPRSRGHRVPGCAAGRRRGAGRDRVRTVRGHPRRDRLPVPAVAGLAVPADGRLTYASRAYVKLWRFEPRNTQPLSSSSGLVNQARR